jgi:hypothetical protein
MKPVKSFEEFRKELNESRKVNEGIMDSVKKTLTKVGDFFKGAGSKFLNMLVAQEKGELPDAVKIYPNNADMAVLKQQHTAVKELPLPEQFTFVEGHDNLQEEMCYPFDTNNQDGPLMEDKITLEHPNTEVNNVNTKKLKMLIETQLDAGHAGRKPAPMLIWGAPGIGKTAIIEQVAKFHDMTLGNNRLIVIDLATMSPEDFFLPAAAGGVGIDYEPTTKATRLPIDYLPLYDVRTGKEGDDMANGVDGKGGIIFFDEIARCSAKVQDVCLKLCDDSRRIGNFELGSKWVIICAANRESDEVDSDKSYRFSSTLGNRFKQVNFVPTFGEWAEWAGSAKDEDGDYVVSPEVTTFLRFFEDYWHNIDPEQLDKMGGKGTIFPTPRAWTKASISLKDQRATYKRMGEPFTTKDAKDAVAQSVGEKAATQFQAFLELTARIKPEDISKVYTDPKNAPNLKDVKGDLNSQIGLIAAVLMQKQKAKLTDEEIKNFLTWVIINDDERMAMRTVAQMLDFHPEVRSNEYYVTDGKNMLFNHYENLKGNKSGKL